jgi:hypothetical protein
MSPDPKSNIYAIALFPAVLSMLVASAASAHWGVPDLPREPRDLMYPAASHGGNYMYNYYIPPAPSSTPWAPCWSPDGRWIAFSMAGSIWRVDPRTGFAEELTYGGKYHSSPDWSPDGKWIVYTADEDTKTIQLEILNVATGESHTLTDDDQIYTDPVFSPDGSRIAYVSTRPNGHFNVYIRQISDGRWTGDEIAVTMDNRYPRDRLYFGEWDMHITPEWTRDGKELLLVSNRNVPLGSGNVWKVAASVNAMDRATVVLAEQSLYRARPDISIDGKRFVYSSTRGSADQYANLYVLPVTGGQPYKLTFYDHDAFHPRWSPDGEWIAYVSNEGGLPQLELLETYGGKRKKVKITDRSWKRPMGSLSVRTVDAATAQTTPARIHITAADGKFYSPSDAFARLTQGGGDHVFHTNGNFHVDVPAGKLRLTAVKGFEFWPDNEEVEIRAGEDTKVDMVLEQMTDMAAKGWYSGSTHMHMNYGGNLHNSLENLMFMSAAEDQDVVNELIANKDNRILDYQYFVPGGGAHPISKPDRLVMVGQEYRPPFFGHVTLIGLRDHLISPWATGYEGTGIESLYPSNTDILRKAKAQGAVTGYAHAFAAGTVEDQDPIDHELGYAKGFMVDAALGTTDGLEWSFSGRAGFYPWYAVLNNGLRVTATGGDDSMSDLHISKLPGSARTYVYTGERGLDAEAWKRGLQEGRAFVSTGPILDFTVDGNKAGEEVKLPLAGAEVEISIMVRSITPLSKVMVIFNGDLVEEVPLSGDRNSLDYKKRISVSRSGWYHVRAEGVWQESFPLDTGFAQAFSNPVWVTIGEQPVRDLKAAEYSIKWIDKLEVLAESELGWRSQSEKDHVFAQFEEARVIYERLAREAMDTASAIVP